MAHSMGVEVVVEGVENSEQLQMLRAMGCDIAQGFLIARPAPEAEFLVLLQAQPQCEGAR
jgi:EAL domain-containing protein (putative c-di-GMP-specific phosphodiesterase class I)